MIRVNVNGRDLSVQFCYSKKYALDIPDPTWLPRLREHLKATPLPKGLGKGSTELIAQMMGARAAAKNTFARINPRFMRVQRPLAQCLVVEHFAGGPEKVLAEETRKLYHRDKPFTRNSHEMEQFRKLLMKYAFSKSELSRDEKRCLWHSFLTRHTVKPNVIIPPPTTPSAASTARGMRSTVVASQPPPSSPDTIPEERRIAAISRNRHAVVNKIVSFRARGAVPNLLELPIQPGELTH